MNSKKQLMLVIAEMFRLGQRKYRTNPWITEYLYWLASLNVTVANVSQRKTFRPGWLPKLRPVLSVFPISSIFELRVWSRRQNSRNIMGGRAVLQYITKPTCWIPIELIEYSYVCGKDDEKYIKKISCFVKRMTKKPQFCNYCWRKKSYFFAKSSSLLLEKENEVISNTKGQKFFQYGCQPPF